MSYAQAVKGLQSSESLINRIRSQAQTELGRGLDIREESLIFSKLNHNQLWNQSQKVLIIWVFILLKLVFQYGHGFIKFILLLAERPELSCETSPNATPRDGDCLIHSKLTTIIFYGLIIALFRCCWWTFKQPCLER